MCENPIPETLKSDLWVPKTIAQLNSQRSHFCMIWILNVAFDWYLIYLFCLHCAAVRRVDNCMNVQKCTCFPDKVDINVYQRHIIVMKAKKEAYYTILR